MNLKKRSKKNGTDFRKIPAVSFVLALFFCIGTVVPGMAQRLKGTVTDRTTGERLAGATVSVGNGTFLSATDENGSFEFRKIPAGTYTVTVSYISYRTKVLENVAVGAGKEADGKEKETLLAVELEPDTEFLQDVVVIGQGMKNTELAQINAARSSALVQSGVSSQQIRRTQDRDASEVIRRIPGISIIEDKFVMVRGLSQRYNNVWINGGAVPSSEADSRAFSFDIIPSAQLDNMMIIKSPAPEYPADFSGGFILIQTRDIPSENSFGVTVGGSVNDRTHFRPFLRSKGSGTDFLGFDNGLRSLRGGLDAELKPIANGIDLQGNGFNNDWKIRSIRPAADLSLSAYANRYWKTDSGDKIALLASLNYGNSYKTFDRMENNLFGVYDQVNDKSNYLRRSTDDQYNRDVRAGIMLNLSYLARGERHRYEFKNIFNQLGKDRYTFREGISAQNNREESAEYYYSSRTAYNGQVTGKHTLDKHLLDWSAGYAYANRNLPDRRRYRVDDALESGVLALTSGNEISREFTRLDEHILSGNLNWSYDLRIRKILSTVKAGFYTEYRTRKYHTRRFYYTWNHSDNSLPSGFNRLDIPTGMMIDAHYGADKLYLLEEMQMRNNYEGNNLLGAGYAAVNLPLGRWNIYAGVRFEYNRMELISNTKDWEPSPRSTVYGSPDFFPSVNAAYKLGEKHQLRLSYGRSVNRPEFREVSSSVFYDFDLASSVQGNPALEPCYVQNADLRYEWYPGAGEMVTLALFYKHFKNPIEWTYTVTGGTDLLYSFTNAAKARNYGLELDVRKELGFMGLERFSWTFNGSLIHSRVLFPEGSRQKNRPMQGQSPYLVNTGIFYRSGNENWSAAVLYNRIGKRIVGVGRSVGTTGGEETANVPDSYEMPYNRVDLNVSRKFGKHWEAKVSFYNILGEKVYFKQFADKVLPGGGTAEVEQITKCYRPGRQAAVSIGYNF